MKLKTTTTKNNPCERTSYPGLDFWPACTSKLPHLWLCCHSSLQRPLPLLFCLVWTPSQMARGQRTCLPMQETQETWVWSLGQEDRLVKEMATSSSIFAGKSHGQRSLVGYSSWGCKRFGHNLVTKWQPPKRTEGYILDTPGRTPPRWGYTWANTMFVEWKEEDGSGETEIGKQKEVRVTLPAEPLTKHNF